MRQLNRRRYVQLALVAAVLHTICGGSEAQQSETTAPSISITALGEVRLPAEIAHLQIGVESKERTAARAAAEAASVLSRVLTAMEGLGFDRDSMPTTDYSVGVDMDWESQKVIGYTATTAVELRLEDLTHWGVSLIRRWRQARTTLRQFDSTSRTGGLRETRPSGLPSKQLDAMPRC